MCDNLLVQHKDGLIKLTITQHLMIKLLQSFFLKWESSPHPNIFNTICIERENSLATAEVEEYVNMIAMVLGLQSANKE